MTARSDDILTGTIDSKSLAGLITELNIARRNCRAYPKGHPVVETSLRKVLAVYNDLLNRHEEIVLAVTGDALMLEGDFLERSNIVFKDFARTLFERGIGALEFRPGLTIDELKKLAIILSLKREDIIRHGGIVTVWSRSCISALSIRPIRYDLLGTTDEESVSAEQSSSSGIGLWEQFARGLTMGSGGPGIDSGSDYDPELVAMILNRQFDQGIADEAVYSHVITGFMQNINTPVPSAEQRTDIPYEKLADLISNLNPELRRQFLNNTFDINSKGNQTAAEDIVNNLSAEAVIETLEDVNQNRLSVPPVIMGLLNRLARHSTPGQRNADSYISEDTDDLSSKMKTIFREHASEEFTPDDYQQKLNQIISADQIPLLKTEDAADLLASLDNRQIENRIGEILINLVRAGVETPEEREMLLQSLGDMFGFYLQTGDYPQLHKMVEQLTDGTFPPEIQSSLKAEYARPEFLNEILDGLSIWGKPRYEDIRLLVHKIGSPFVETLLDHLAEEKNMSVRRFFMDCLIAMGPITRVPISERLYDDRWYFQRNLLVILSAQNDPSIVPLIRPLLHQSDGRLRQDILKTLAHFHDPEAEKQIYFDLSSTEHEQLAAAIQMAGRCNSPEVFNKLVSLLAHGGLKQSDYEIKSAVVRSLAEIGRMEALPELAKILGSSSLLSSKLLASLKIDIVRSLANYPLNVARPVLERLASENNEVARQAQESLRNISGKPL